MSKYTRYQDYVIRDGRLIGEFEEMYRDFEDPWEQSVQEIDALDKSIGLMLLKKYAHQRVLEYGCGLGHYTSQLHAELGVAAGVDISNTAIDKAKNRYSGPEFYVGSILDREAIENFKPDALVFAELTWYVLEFLPEFKRLMSKSLAGRGFLHILTTYPHARQAYGKEYFTDLDGIMSYWSDTIDILDWGVVSKKGACGVSRSFFYGTIK